MLQNPGTMWVFHLSYISSHKRAFTRGLCWDEHVWSKYVYSIWQPGSERKWGTTKATNTHHEQRVQWLGQISTQQKHTCCSCDFLHFPLGESVAPFLIPLLRAAELLGKVWPTPLRRQAGNAPLLLLFLGPTCTTSSSRCWSASPHVFALCTHSRFLFV